MELLSRLGLSDDKLGCGGGRQFVGDVVVGYHEQTECLIKYLLVGTLVVVVGHVAWVNDRDQQRHL